MNLGRLRMFRTACTFLLGAIVGSYAIPAVNAQFRNVTTSRLLTVDLAGWCEGKEVTVDLNDIGAGTSPKHYHPGYSFTYLLEGSEEYAQEGKPVKTVKAGDVLNEVPMEIHAAENRSWRKANPSQYLCRDADIQDSTLWGQKSKLRRAQWQLRVKTG
jgi:Cupin domain